MEKLKNAILQEFENYWAKEDKLIQDNAQYLDKNTYSDEFVENKKSEIERSKKANREITSKIFKKMGNEYINNLKIDTEKIDSLEYQTKLANVLKIIELKDGNISKNNLKFMINARDIDTLQALSLKYNTNTLKEAMEEANIEGLKHKVEELVYYSSLELYDFMGKPRDRNETRKFLR